MADQIAMIILAVYVVGYLWFMFIFFIEKNEKGENHFDDVIEKLENRLGPEAGGLDRQRVIGVCGLLVSVMLLFWPFILISSIWKKFTGQN